MNHALNSSSESNTSNRSTSYEPRTDSSSIFNTSNRSTSYEPRTLWCPLVPFGMKLSSGRPPTKPRPPKHWIIHQVDPMHQKEARAMTMHWTHEVDPIHQIEARSMSSTWCAGTTWLTHDVRMLANVALLLKFGPFWSPPLWWEGPQQARGTRNCFWEPLSEILCLGPPLLICSCWLAKKALRSNKRFSVFVMWLAGSFWIREKVPKQVAPSFALSID